MYKSNMAVISYVWHQTSITYNCLDVVQLYLAQQWSQKEAASSWLVAESEACSNDKHHVILARSQIPFTQQRIQAHVQ